MRSGMIARFGIFLSLAVLCSTNFAAEKKGKKKAPHEHNCAEHMRGVDWTSFEPSGRDHDVAHLKESDAEIIYDIARRLGMRIGDQRIVESSPENMGAVLANGRYPAPHFVDGMALAQTAGHFAGVLEVVFPGHSHNTQFVRDSNDRNEARIVYAHVAGHHDVFYSNAIFQQNAADPIPTSWEMAMKMSKWKYYQPEELRNFYHALHSIPAWTVSGRYDAPDQFAPHMPNRLAWTRKDGQRSRASSSVFSAIQHNIPKEAPLFAEDLTRMFATTDGRRGEILLSKFLNEGWAVFAEYMILAHTPWVKEGASIDFAAINSAVVYPSVSNPYWLGTQGWVNLWQKFVKRPEIASLGRFEQHKAFVEEAHRVMIAYPTDRAFLSYALDDDWVIKHNLFLYRPFIQGVDTLPPGMEGWSQYPRYICISRDPKTVLRFLITQTVAPEVKVPDIRIADQHDPETGGLLLDHWMRYGITLKRDSMPRALYQMAQIVQRPVSLDTYASHYWGLDSLRRYPNPFDGAYVWQNFGWPTDPSQDPNHRAKLYPFRITVTPQGKISVRTRSAPDPADVPGTFAQLSESQLQTMYKRFERSLSGFIANLKLSDVDAAPRRRADDPLFTTKAARGVAAAETAVPGEIDLSYQAARYGSNLPTVPEALIEFKTLMRLRMNRIIDLAAQGKWNAEMVRGGMVRLRGIMPDTPELQLDHSILRKRRPDKAPTPAETRQMTEDQIAQRLVHHHESLQENAKKRVPRGWWEQEEVFASTDVDWIPMEDLSMGVGQPGRFNPIPGDVWEKKPQDGKPGNGESDGEGDEDGDEDGDDGEPDEGDDEGDQESPGQGDGDGGDSIIDIPLDDWIEAIKQRLEFPNLRPVKGGDIEQVQYSVDNVVRTPNGNVDMEATAMEIYEHGIGMQQVQRRKKKRQGVPPGPRPSSLELFRMGLDRMSDEQIFVQKTVPIPDPISEAVIVWITDLSGSMGGDPIKIMKNMVANERALLKSEYKRLHEVFVVYDSFAREVPTEEEFFKINLGGGTDASGAVILSGEILEERFPAARFNRFVRHFSDGYDSGDIVIPHAEKLAKQIEFFGYSHVAGFNWGDGSLPHLSAAYKALAERDPDRVGFAELNKDLASVIRTLQAFYGPRPKKK